MWSFDDFLFPFFILNLQGSARDMKRFTTSFIPNFTKKCEIAVRQLIYCGHLTIFFFFIVTVQIPNIYALIFQARCRPWRFTTTFIPGWTWSQKMSMGRWVHYERFEAYFQRIQMVALYHKTVPSLSQVSYLYEKRGVVKVG